jgi:superfamily II DNA or RNA helicase
MGVLIHMSNAIIPLADFDEVEFYGERQIRWYQLAARNEVIEAVSLGIKRILVDLPTGTGKTLAIACTLCSPEMKKVLGVPLNQKLKVMFIAHMSRLLTQAERTFAEENGVELILQSTMSPIPQKIIDNGWDITVMDEAHHEATVSMQYQLETILGEIPLIGLTATPIRPDGMVIKFEKFIKPITREQAVIEGHLAETNLYTIADGSERSKVDILCDIFDEYAHKMNGTLVFVRTKKEVNLITQHLTKLGYKTVGLLNQTAKELDEILDSFSLGDIQFIVSCNKLGEGIDVLGCSTVVLGRTLGSYSLLNQIVGRAARPDCDCNIYEIVNPLSATNLDTTCVVGTPKTHILIHYAKGKWQEEIFDYVA